MVMTHKSMKERLKKGIYVKEDDPSRKFMSRADAVAKNKRLKEDRLKVERFEQDLRNKRDTPSSDDLDSAPDETFNEEAVRDEERKEEKAKVRDDIDSLKKKLDKERGPGSKARKDVIQDKIDELMKQV